MGNAKVSFELNGKPTSLESDDSRPLLEVLREDLGLIGTKYGCGEAECRACTVLLDGRPVPSCVVPVGQVAGRTVVTIEGLAEGPTLHPVQQAFIDEGAMQCGYCVPGMILATVALLEAYPNPRDEDIIAALDGHLCRCCNYARLLDAVRTAAERV